MLLAFAFAAQTKPDFSGVWQLNLEKSTFHGQPPKELLVKIEYLDPTLTQTVLIVAADGREQQQTFTYETSGCESTNKMGINDVQTRAHWNGAELVIDSVMKTPSRTFHFSDHWPLSPMVRDCKWRIVMTTLPDRSRFSIRHLLMWPQDSSRGSVAQPPHPRPDDQRAGIELYHGDRRLVRPGGVTDKLWEVSALVAVLQGTESKKAA